MKVIMPSNRSLPDFYKFSNIAHLSINPASTKTIYPASTNGTSTSNRSIHYIRVHSQVINGSWYEGL